MKSIKLVFIAWLMGLLFSFSTVQAQSNDTIPPMDSIGVLVDVLVTVEPVEFEIKSETLENNQALQAMLEMESNKTEALKQNLSTLNQILVNQDPNFTELDLLFYYDVDLKNISNKENLINCIWWITTGIFLIVMLIVVSTKYIYFTKKVRPSVIYLSIGGLLLLGYVMPVIMKSLFIDGYELWQNVSKLF